MRLDLYLVENNFFKTRNKAKQAIDDKAIYVDDKLITKALMFYLILRLKLEEKFVLLFHVVGISYLGQ